MYNYDEVMKVYTIVLKDTSFSHSIYVRKELKKAMKELLCELLKLNSISFKEDANLKDITEIIKKSDIDVFNSLPYESCINSDRSNQDFITIFRVCLVCFDKFRVDNKELIVTTFRYKVYANSNHCILIDSSDDGKRISQCLKVENCMDFLAFKIRKMYAIPKEIEAVKDSLIIEDRLKAEGLFN